jgi:hypothetical protein
MDPEFIYDPGNHLSYSDITDSEISEGNGYLRGSKMLSNMLINITEGDTIITCDSAEWTATGGNIPDFKSICIINNTHSENRILGNVTMDNSYTIVSGSSFMLHFPNGIFNAIPNPA